MVRLSNIRSNPRRRRRALARREEILRAAARAFRRHGFAATGMREIGDEADLSTANLYYYFGSKQELLFFCQDHSLERMLAGARVARASRLPADEKLRMVIRTQLTCMLDELDGAAAHLEVDALPPKLRAKVVEKRDAYEREVREIVAAGVKAGRFTACEPALVTRAILGALNWTVRWYRPGGPQPPGRVADEFANYLVRGLLR